MESRAAKLLSYSEKRLPILFRQAALQHIRREYAAARVTLLETVFLLDCSDRPDWISALKFAREWADAVKLEAEGGPLDTAPAAWIHLSQELASLIESKGDWTAYLDSRWCIESGQLEVRRRLYYGVLSALALGLSGLILIVMARHAILGHWDWLASSPLRSPKEHVLTLILILGRVAGTVMMIEHGIVWGLKAITGRADKPLPFFLGAENGPALVQPPHS